MIVEINFDIIYPIWRDLLWPNRTSPIESTSAMNFLGDYDIKNMNYKPTFFAYIYSNQIAGVNSGHLCFDNSYRSRGLYVSENFRKKGIGLALLQKTIEQAINENAKFVWSYPRQQSWMTYERAGFQLESCWENSEQGINAYCKKDLKD